MNKGGRPQDPLWQFFIKLDNDTKVKCTTCGSAISAKIERMRNHHSRCSRVPLLSSEGELQQNNEPSTSTAHLNPLNAVQPDTTPSPCTFSSFEQSAEPPTVKKPKLQQPQMTGFTVVTDNKTKQQLDEQIARFFYACNIPFAVAEHHEFKQMLMLLRPGYKPPNRKAIGGTLLDKVYESVNEVTARNLKDKPVTLIQDGWSDIHNSPVIAHCIHTGSKAYFLSSEETGAHKKTSDYCAELAKKSIAEAEEKYRCQVTAVVTDNEKKMLKMREMLHAEDESLIVMAVHRIG